MALGHLAPLVARVWSVDGPTLLTWHVFRRLIFRDLLEHDNILGKEVFRIVPNTLF